jgi:hypothetical protein
MLTVTLPRLLAAVNLASVIAQALLCKELYARVQDPWRKEIKARRAQFPLHKNFDERWASLPKCPPGHYRVLGDEFFSMHTLFWLGDYDMLEEAKCRADGLNNLYNWRGYVLDEYGHKVTL